MPARSLAYVKVACAGRAVKTFLNLPSIDPELEIETKGRLKRKSRLKFCKQLRHCTGSAKSLILNIALAIKKGREAQNTMKYFENLRRRMNAARVGINAEEHVNLSSGFSHAFLDTVDIENWTMLQMVTAGAACQVVHDRPIGHDKAKEKALKESKCILYMPFVHVQLKNS